MWLVTHPMEEPGIGYLRSRLGCHSVVFYVVRRIFLGTNDSATNLRLCGLCAFWEVIEHT